MTKEAFTETDRGLLSKEEQQLLNGSGVGENLLGLYTAATAFALPSGATAPSQRLDRLRAAVKFLEESRATGQLALFAA